MKYIGPAIFMMVLLLVYAVIFRPDWVWALGGVTVLAVLLGIVITFIVEVKEQKGEDK